VKKAGLNEGENLPAIFSRESHTHSKWVRERYLVQREMESKREIVRGREREREKERLK